MATNTLLTDAKITKEALSVLHNTLGFTKSVNREYSGEFANTGAKIGQSVNVRKPNRYAVQQGPKINPQGTTESSTPLTLNRQWVVPMTFSSAELTLSIDEFSNRYIKPAIAKMASVIDLDCYTAAIKGMYADGVTCPGAGPVNFVVGTPGYTPGTADSVSSGSGLTSTAAPAVYLNAGRILDINAAPRDRQRTTCIDPAANAMSVGALSGLFNPQGIISEQYKNGLLGNALGFDFVMDQNVYTFNAGTRVASGVDTVATNSGWATPGTVFSSITYTAGSGNNTKTVVAVDTFTIACVYHVNPETQQSTGVLYQFVIDEDATLSTGANTLSIRPAKQAGTGIVDGDFAVVSTSASAAVVYTSGAASTATPQNLAFHKEAFTLATADLELPRGIDFGARESFDGISMRIIRDYDVMNDFMVCRIDVLGGFSVLRPELACRIAG